MKHKPQVKKIGVIGGDNRIIYLINEFIDDGYEVNYFGFDKLENKKNTMPLVELINYSDVLISGIPFSKDGEYISSKYSKIPISIEFVFESMKKNQRIFSGYVTDATWKIIENHNIKMIDLFKNENIAMSSAIATAEGAIKIAIENTDFTIHSSEILIIGYGRIGMILAKTLMGMGGNITIVTKEEKDILTAKNFGYESMSDAQLDNALLNKNIIFNTAPVTQIDKDNMKNINENSLIIDLASAPFGVNYEDSLNFNNKVIYASGLPGIVAPYNVGVVYEKRDLQIYLGDEVSETC